MKSPQGALFWDLDYIHRKLSKSRYVYIAETERCGLGIFAAKDFPNGEAIIRDDDGDYFDGAITAAQVEALGLDLATHCFQIDHDRFLLPHGSIDDLINHSCDPAAGIRLTAKGYELIALRNIEKSDELTYDYSTYISSRERLRCRCGSPRCRKDTGPFRELASELRAYYLERGVVGAFAAAGPAQAAAGSRLESVRA
jgi:SET domain